MATEEFQDFSYATHWERLAGEIEQVLRRWLWTGEGDLTPELRSVELKQKLHFRKEPYLLSLELPDNRSSFAQASSEISLPTVPSDESLGSYSSSHSDDEEFEFLPANEHQPKSGSRSGSRSNPEFSSPLFLSPLQQLSQDGMLLQRWFGLRRFVLLHAGSGRISDNQETTTLLSAAAVALSDFPRPLAILLPVQNAFRDAYRGVAVQDGRSVFFDVDSSHLTLRTDHLRSVEGQLQIMAKHLQRYAPEASRMCEALSNGETPSVEDHELQLASCVTYQLPLPSTDKVEAETDWSDQWDEGAVWQPWAAEKDPVASLELDLVWDHLDIDPERLTPSLSARSATGWRVHVLAAERKAFESWTIFTAKDAFIRHPLVFDVQSMEEFDGDNFRSMAARLMALFQAVGVAKAARSVSDLGSEEWWDDSGTRGPAVPPENVFTESLIDLFGDEAEGQPWCMTRHVEYCDVSNDIKIRWPAPLDSLTARLGLHAVVYRNAKAVAMLWGQFVQTIRLRYWERLKSIPLYPNRLSSFYCMG